MSFLCPRFIDVKTFRMMKMSEERGNMLHGVLLIALFSCAAFYIGDFPWVKSLSFSPMIVGIMLGMLYANSLRNRLPATWVPGILFCSKRVLRLGIVLYGFRLTFQDVLAVGAYDGARLVGLAGCSADCESMWQIGVDVLPGYRRRGVAAALTSRLAAETLARGKVPFYCAAWSNIKSVRNAVKCGFVPAWAELTAKPEAFVRELNGQ